MKVLLDSCVWGGAREALEAAGHEVTAVADWGGDPGDPAVLARAFAEGRTLVTLDKDFGELVIVRGSPHAGIVRLVGLRAREQGTVAVQILGAHDADLRRPSIITVERDRVRVRGPSS